jgi:hypothetical protein
MTARGEASGGRVTPREAAPAAATARAAVTAPPSGRALGAVVPVALWLAAAAISGFTIRRYLEPFDEGFLLQAATRIADGQWPYRDFGWPYGPGQAGVVALAFKAFGPSVLWWRVLRVVADATIALLVWGLVRRPVGDRWALAAWLTAAVTIAQPTSANPFPVALAFALGAVLAAARGRYVTAGVVAALATAWRPDLGVVAMVAAVVAAIAASRAVPPRRAVASLPGRPAPTARRPATPAHGRPAPSVRIAGAWLVGSAAVFAPFLVAAGPRSVYDELIERAAGDGTWWRLPFPFTYDGPLRAWPPWDLASDLKDALGYELPLIALAASAVLLALLVVHRRRGPELAGLLVLAVGCGAYLLTRPDELHVQPLLVCLAALVPIAVAPAPRAPLARAAAVGLALIALAGVANRLSALVLPPDLEPVHLAGVPGIRVPPTEARALPALAARVQQLVPPGEPIYVAPRRSDLVTLSDPLVHFLVRRPNVLDRDVSLQARPQEQVRIVAALAAARPRVVVRWTDPASSRPEPNRRGRPSGSRALDDYLASAYRRDSRFGAYDVLVAR